MYEYAYFFFKVNIKQPSSESFSSIQSLSQEKNGGKAYNILTSSRRITRKHANYFRAADREHLYTHSDFCVFLPEDL